MLPLTAAVVFLFAFGKKVGLPAARLAVWSALTVIAYVFSHSAALYVLLALFISAPFILHFKSIRAQHMLFSLCVIGGCFVSLLQGHIPYS